MTDSNPLSFAKVFADEPPPTSVSDSSALDPETVFARIDEPAVGTQIDDHRRQPRFEGDTSELAAEVCWALQQLVGAHHVPEESKSWPVILDSEDVLRSRLSELGLLLVINREHRYAYTRQADDPSPRSRAILRSKTLSLAASALALFLYQQYILSPDDPVVERADMVDHMLTTYRPAGDTDEVEFKKKIATAIGRLDELHLIKPVTGTPDRFTIYPAITAVVTAEQVSALRVKYREIAGGTGSVADTEEQEAR